MTIITITDTDLINNKNFYDIDTLEFNIKNLNKKILLSTQKLTPEFCIKYILDMDIDSGSEDSYIYDIDYILYFQKHITHEEMSRMFKEIN